MLVGADDQEKLHKILVVSKWAGLPTGSGGIFLLAYDQKLLIEGLEPQWVRTL
jgi:hypothetical protein